VIRHATDNSLNGIQEVRGSIPLSSNRLNEYSCFSGK